MSQQIDHGQLAYENFFKGYSCSQSVVAAFADEMGLPVATAVRMASGFGGGYGRLREVCGAFSGVVLVLGMLYGAETPEGKTAVYADVQELAKQYRERNGKNSIVCRELLGLQNASPESPVASPRTETYYKKRPCPELVRLCAELMEQYIQKHPRSVCDAAQGKKPCDTGLDEHIRE